MSNLYNTRILSSDDLLNGHLFFNNENDVIKMKIKPNSTDFKYVSNEVEISGHSFKAMIEYFEGLSVMENNSFEIIIYSLQSQEFFMFKISKGKNIKSLSAEYDSKLAIKLIGDKYYTWDDFE